MARKHLWLLAVIGVCFLTTYCLAEEDKAEPENFNGAFCPKPENATAGNQGLRPGLTCYEPAYFGFIGWKPGSAPNRQLECYIPFQVSMQYPLIPLNLNLFGEWEYAGGKLIDQDQSALYFVYNGKYDFFMYGRYSAPVVSRRQNPGVYFEFSRFLGGPDAEWGYFHESNGQDIETKEAYVARQAKDGHAQDYLSRGWDYWLYGAKKKFELPDEITPG
jgi:outer membrane phospholipase A